MPFRLFRLDDTYVYLECPANYQDSDMMSLSIYVIVTLIGSPPYLPSVAIGLG